MTHEIKTTKHPGDLVLATNGKLFKVDAKGALQPHEQPHRREQRLRAERFRSRAVQPPADAMGRPQHPILALLFGGR